MGRVCVSGDCAESVSLEQLFPLSLFLLYSSYYSNTPSPSATAKRWQTLQHGGVAVVLPRMEVPAVAQVAIGEEEVHLPALLLPRLPPLRMLKRKQDRYEACSESWYLSYPPPGLLRLCRRGKFQFGAAHNFGWDSWDCRAKPSLRDRFRAGRGSSP